MRRFVVRPEAVEGSRVRFDPGEAHHLARVLRLRPGALLEATDGAGRLYTVRLDGLGAAEAWGTIEAADTGAAESPCAVTLAPAVLKGERMTWLVQKATELGVARILPVTTGRVVARAAGDRSSGRSARWQRVAREAVKQCRRAVVPLVEPPRPFAEVLAEVPAHDVAWALWEGGGRPLAEAAREAGRPRRLLLLVGPEGGFTPGEVAMAQSAGVGLVGLGPRILRAESAALAALAVCQHLFGDLGQGRSPGHSPPGPPDRGGPGDVPGGGKP
jgi:16S rRNA (uracil1498-N3)-methyltransferase